jgi:hypothetical protein
MIPIFLVTHLFLISFRVKFLWFLARLGGFGKGVPVRRHTRIISNVDG